MLQNIIDELTLYEKMVLKALESLGYESSPEKIVATQSIDIKAVMSAAGSLSSKGLIEVQKDVEEIEKWTEIGEEIAKNTPKGEWSTSTPQGNVLPDRAVHIKLMQSENNQIAVNDIIPQYRVGIGHLRQKRYAEVNNGIIAATPLGIEKFPQKYPDENHLSDLLNHGGSMPVSITSPEIISAVKKRKNIIEIYKEPKFMLKITEKGKQLLEMGIEIKEEATQLTHEQLKTGSWKDLEYRSYDIHAEHPETFPGKMHPLQRTIEDIRQIFLKMGFTESRGSILESAFWNFDCLFQPQDHAAREMQDTFYIGEPKYVNLPHKKLVEKVAEAHENGGNTGSEGWGYSWDVEVAKQSVLRTHTTCVSARFLADHKPPLKMFSVGRVFRRETITYKHLPEFHQVEGIVASEDITFRNLLGILKEFYHKLGFEVRFRPAYFPYTYLSVECEIYLPEKETWIELGGAGMFRPEVLEPLGVKTPVAAFGLGIERLAMLRLDIKDIRMLYKSDIGWLRHLPVKMD